MCCGRFVEGGYGVESVRSCLGRVRGDGLFVRWEVMSVIGRDINCVDCY